MVGGALALGLGAGLAARGTGWTPASLGPVFWLGGADPAGGRLWQDGALTTRAALQGARVGAARGAETRLAEGLALQSLEAKRPQLVQWPKGGARNLAMGAQAVDDPAYWAPVKVSNGLTFTRLATGSEGGQPYVDLGISGTSATGFATGFFAHELSALAAGVGDSFVARMTARHTGGSLPAGAGVGLEIAGLQGTTSIEGIGSARISSSSDTTPVVTWTIAAPAVDQARPGLYLRCTAGQVFDGVTYRIKGLQFERGSSAGAAQLNFGPHDIRQAGVAPVWHLARAAGEGLELVLPSGNYTRASVDPLGTVTVTAGLALGGTSDLTDLPRLADILYLPRALTSAEVAVLGAYWQLLYQA